MFEEAVKYQEIACITFRRISKHVTQARHFVPKISHHALQHLACQMAMQYISYRNMLYKVCIKSCLQISTLLYKPVQLITNPQDTRTTYSVTWAPNTKKVMGKSSMEEGRKRTKFWLVILSTEYLFCNLNLSIIMLNSGFLHTNIFCQNTGMQYSLINTGVEAIQVSKPLTCNIKDLEDFKTSEAREY